MSLAYRDRQLLPPPECVPDGQWTARIGQNKITLRLTRKPEHAVVGDIQIPQLVASASCVVEGGLPAKRSLRNTEVMNRLQIMLVEITEWVEFAAGIGEAMHIDVELDDIEIESGPRRN